jgi:hypothetical protein
MSPDTTQEFMTSFEKTQVNFLASINDKNQYLLI